MKRKLRIEKNFQRTNNINNKKYSQNKYQIECISSSNEQNMHTFAKTLVKLQKNSTRVTLKYVIQYKADTD